MMRAIYFVACCAMAAGCTTTKETTPVELQKINIAVPVPCQVATPERPAMPTEALAPGADPFGLLRAALAEIDRREGYELKLLSALEACTRSIQVQSKLRSE